MGGGSTTTLTTQDTPLAVLRPNEREQNDMIRARRAEEIINAPLAPRRQLSAGFDDPSHALPSRSTGMRHAIDGLAATRVSAVAAFPPLALSLRGLRR
jgi:hypothetical protein